MLSRIEGSAGRRRGAAVPVRLAALVLAVSLAALPAHGWAAAAKEAAAPAPRRIAVVITQAVGVGPLADRLGGIASAAAAKGGATVLDPAASSRQLRVAGGPDPLTCGSDARCLEAIGAALDTRWVLAVGIGRFGGMYGLDLRLVDRQSDAKPAGSSSTWAEPGPDWEVAMAESLTTLLPPELRAPPRGKLLVRANEPGELFVDGEPVGTLPLEKPIEVDAGPHAIELRGASGSANAAVEIGADALAEVELTLAPALAGAPGRWMRTGSYIAGGSAVALLAAAIATNVSASSTMDDARAQKRAGESFAATRSDALDTIGTSRLLYGAAAGVAIGAVVLFLLDKPASAQAEAVALPADSLPVPATP